MKLIESKDYFEVWYQVYEQIGNQACSLLRKQVREKVINQAWVHFRSINYQFELQIGNTINEIG
jgi:oligoendopeptidase F